MSIKPGIKSHDGTKFEYRVRPVARYVVTRYSNDGASAAVETVGEFQNEALALQTANAHAVAYGGEVSSNILLRGQPHDLAALMHNIAEQVGPHATDGVVVLADEKGEVNVFGLGPVDNSINPYDLLDKGLKKLHELGVV